ncbi:UDP-glucose 4-epimerase [Helicobacter ailurogastricus]|uniref:UDP-glucose 4-epimerase n=2 Tax=Helicobacter ailurogastricus TaxID=1578720 RepID=A0A0K2Y742_9HELI|nr:UDP-glucose 4-epimerase [Helicobacter ailurogastricus]CRF52960.1 UDP-glucose 4-epimerase [Helicobacter ailurogastricus]
MSPKIKGFGMLLFTGACGYIGSSVARLFLEQTNYKIWIVDNLSTGFEIHAKTLKHLYPERVFFDMLDLSDTNKLEHLIQAKQQEHPIQGVLHFAAKLLVEESTRLPLDYYTNNTLNTLQLARLCVKHGIKHFVFSSTAAVYGQGAQIMDESAPLSPINPYGASKMMSERILLDTSKVAPFSCALLRYFNVAGATRFNDYLSPFALGQRAKNATHLIKVACECATHKRPFMAIFGNDYPTPDGTCVRDYIHIDDLALAHLEAFKTLQSEQKSQIYNVGYGRGYSVAEVVAKVKEISGVDFKVQMQGRRAGDPASLIADNSKILSHTAFKPQYDSLETIIKSAYEWEQYLGAQPC